MEITAVLGGSVLMNRMRGVFGVMVTVPVRGTSSGTVPGSLESATKETNRPITLPYWTWLGTSTMVSLLRLLDGQQTGSVTSRNPGHLTGTTGAINPDPISNRALGGSVLSTKNDRRRHSGVGHQDHEVTDLGIGCSSTSTDDDAQSVIGHCALKVARELEQQVTTSSGDRYRQLRHQDLSTVSRAIVHYRLAQSDLPSSLERSNSIGQVLLKCSDCGLEYRCGDGALGSVSTRGDLSLGESR